MGWESCVVNSISFTVCPDPHPSGAVQESSFRLIGRLTVVFTRPFFGWRVTLLLKVVGAVALFAAWGQLPLLFTQAQDRLTVAVLVTQTSMVPNPFTSTLTLNGVVPHEKSATFTDCPKALPGSAKPPIASATVAATLVGVVYNQASLSGRGGIQPG